MSKTYNLTATLKTGKNLDASPSGDWRGYDSTNVNSSDLGKVGRESGPIFWATNMVFDSATLSTLRNKTINGITLEINVTQAAGAPGLIAWKYNSTASGNTNSQAWARSDNAGTYAAGDSSIATNSNPSFAENGITVGTHTLTIKALPQYGLVAGPYSSSRNGVWKFSSAILHVTTNEVTISYKKGASGSGTEYTDVAAPNSNLRGAIFTRTGYTQTGWATSDGGAKVYNLSAQYTGTADLTLYPYWTADTYTVTYAPGSYSSGSNYTATKTYGVALTLRGATYTRAHYSHDGWSVNSDGSTKDYNLSGSYTNNAATTLYPHWKADTYTVSYNANGGSGAPAAQTKTYGVSLTLSATIPSRTNYIFLGWATSATGTATYRTGTNHDQNTSYTANAAVTLYAIWQAAKSTLSSITSEVTVKSNVAGSGTASWNIVNTAYTYKLVITYSNAPAVTVNVAANTASTSFSIPTTWLSYMPNVSSVTATATLTTYASGTSVGSTSLTFTVKVDDSVKPTISSFTHAPYAQNSVVNGWGQQYGTYVQGYSQVDLSVSASAGTGASIVSIAFSGAGVSQSSTATTARSTVLSNTGRIDYSVTVTDSRNRSVTSYMTGDNRPYFYEYNVPVISTMTAFRSNSSGTADAISGTYINTSAKFSLSSCGGRNTFSVRKIEYKLHSAPSWTSGVSTATSEQSYTIGGGNIAITSSYDVRCTVTDALSHTTTYVVLVPPIVGFAVGLNNDRARFGGPVEKAGLQVDWDAEFNGVVDVTPRRCYASLSSEGWYRVMVFDGSSSGVSGGVAFTVDITLFDWARQATRITLWGVSGSLKFDHEQSVSYAQLFDKIRYMQKDGYGYIDVHYTAVWSGSRYAACHFDVKQTHNATYTPVEFESWWTAINFTPVDPSPSGETQLALYTFAANTVNHSDTTTSGVRTIVDRNGKLVTVTVEATGGISCAQGQYTTVATLPSWAYPKNNVYPTVDAYGGNNIFAAQITTGGNVQLYPVLSSTSYYRLTCTFVTT